MGVDVGGTFTDLAAVGDDGAVEARKVLSTPSDQSDGVVQAIERLAPPADGVARVVHGTTIVTNMLLERAGARVVLCATRGASDLLELRRQERASLYDLSAQHPPPLVDATRVVAIAERVTPDGVLEALTPEAIDAATRAVAALEPEIIAVSLLHSYADPRHEEALADGLRAVLPGVDVVLSSEVLSEIREYERTATTVCEAYVRPGVARYLERLTDRVAALAVPAPSVMSSSGGSASASRAARQGASLALSGPAGGVAGAAAVARAAGFDRALTIDIGGTSADVGLILDGEALMESGGSVAGVPIALPRVLVETVSAGGGSIAWIDDGGALRVGPRSAGVRPGPVAFGRGGSLPTVTDAHIAIGNIEARRMSDGVELDFAAATGAVDALAARLSAERDRVSLAIIAAADAAMARALRRVSVQRGIDPRGCVLIAFGGGGPLHACGLAERLGMTRVLVPPHAGVLSALGLAVAPERRVSVASVMRLASEVTDSELADVGAALTDRAGGSGEPAWSTRARYAGQGHELDVPFSPGDDGRVLASRFAVAHGRRYGFTLERDVELVSARCVTTGGGRDVVFARTPHSRWSTEERYDDGGVFDAVLRGRSIVALPDATMLVENGWTARSLAIGGWLMERSA